MYSPKSVALARNALEAGLGYTLREYNPTEVEDMAVRLRDVVWDQETGNPSRPLLYDEEQYVVNERLMSKISFQYWLTRYCKILTDEKVILPLTPWPSQQAILDVLAAEEDKQIRPCPSCGKVHPKIRMILLKSRQVGGTAISEALVAHLAFLSPHTKGIIASDHPDTSLELYQTLDKMYEHLPGWLKPHRDWNVKGTHMRMPALNSGVICGAGNQKTTLGQGMNVDIAHLTEVSTWSTEMCKAIDIDLMPAFDSSHKHHTLIMLESTGAGAKGNWFHDLFQNAREGNSLFRPVFIAWYLRPGWAVDAEGIIFTDETKAMAGRVERETGKTLSREQMAWYQLKRRELESKGDLEMFYQEFPSTVGEAFQTGFRSIFPITLRTKLRDEVRMPILVCDVNYETRKLRQVPLEEWKRANHPGKEEGRVILWELPKPGYLYIIGVDASYGMTGKDAAAVEVLRVGNKWAPDEQVAEFRGVISPLDLAIPAWILGKMYLDQESGLWAQVVVEVNPGSPGIVTQTELMRWNYPHFYIWKKPTRGDGGWTKEVGWYTTAATRPLLTDMGVDYIKKGNLLINSPFFIEEMSWFVATEMKNGKRKLEHAPGYHDDRIMSLFMALYVAHEQDMTYLADERRRMAEQRRAPKPETQEFAAMGITWAEAMAKWEESLIS